MFCRHCGKGIKYCAVAHVIGIVCVACQPCDVGLASVAMAFQLPFVIFVGLFVAMYDVQKNYIYHT